MNLSAAQRARLQELACEAQKIVGDCLHPDGTPMTFDQLEEECIQAGDFLTATMLAERTRQRQHPVTAPGCPTCNRPGELTSDVEPRVLQTDRGEVTWNEPTFYCRQCRRSFFPSLR